MKRKIMLTVFTLCVILTLVGCKNGYDSIKEQESDKDADKSQETNKTLIESTSSEESTKYIEISGEISNIEEEVYEYNESGKIIIVMYHKFATEEKDEWTRSYDNFYNDLKYLYEHNYVSISLNDYLNNNIKVPLGKTPIIFTFDDGTSGQFNLIKNESGDLIANPNSAVGIMEKFYSEHPDFGLNGTFFINGTSFFFRPRNEQRKTSVFNK